MYFLYIFVFLLSKIFNFKYELHIFINSITQQLNLTFFQNLFAFGDKDGVLYDAKLQHALGLAASHDETILFVADTYNHKLKRIDVLENKITTLQFSGSLEGDKEAICFKEPGGLCVSADGKKLYVADTNNHRIKVLSLGRNHVVSGVAKLDLR